MRMANATIRIGIGKLRGFPCDLRHGEQGRGRGMGFEHVGDAGGSVAMLGAQLREIGLSIVGESGIAAELWASSWWWSLLGQEPQELVGVAGFKLIWQAQENVTRNFVGTKD